jgi:hypothetical protein
MGTIPATMLVLALLLARPASAQAQPKGDNSVFGIMRLGGPLTLPECARLRKSNVYVEDDQVACFERIILPWEPEKWATPVRNETVTVVFPVGHEPPIISGTKIVAGIVDGNLESVGFNTAGLARQDETLKLLREKYGEPAKITEETKQNNFGASFESHFAVWSFANLSVSFQGCTDRRDSGLVNIDTPKGLESRMATLEKLKSGPKL